MKMPLVLASALLFGSGSAFANTIDQSEGLTLLDVGSLFGAPVEFNPFNPALGALTGVTLSLEASFSGTVGIENVSGSPDVASGIIAGSLTVSTTDHSLSVGVSPDAPGPTHDFTAFDGALDYAGTSGATDSVSGADASASAAAPPPASALASFIGSEPIFLTLSATTFPVAEGLETESVTETANASALVKLTYNYTPAASVPEPGTLALGMVGIACLLGLGGWRSKRVPLFTST
jgi:hypothetical protein